MDTKNADRHRGHGHHRAAGAPRLREEFKAWQEEINGAASQYPGFLGAEINPPTAVQPDWVVVYRFDSIANVQAWINSATRQERLDRGAAVPRRPRHPAGDRRRSREPRPAGHGRRHPPREPEDVDEFLAVAGAASAGGEQVRGLPRHRAVPARRGHPGRVDRAVPLRNAPRPGHVAHLRGAQRSCWPRARSSPTSTPAPSTTPSAAGSPSTSTANEAPPPSESRPPSPSGWASTRRSCCSPLRCRR